MPLLESRYVEVEGAALEVLVGGAAGPPICRMPHPVNVPSRDGGVYAELGRVVWVSPRGLRGSAAGAGHDLTIDRLVDDVEAVRRALGIDRWFVAGMSGGGEVLLRYALRYPDPVIAILATCCPPGFRQILADPRTPLSPEYPEWKRLLAQRSPPESGSGLVWEALTPGAWVLYEHGRPRIVIRAKPPERPSERQRVVFEEIVDYRFEDLGRLRAPALVLHGRRDTSVPFDYGEALRAALPNAELVAFECEHDVMAEVPEPYREAVARFLAAHGQSTTAPKSAPALKDQ